MKPNWSTKNLEEVVELVCDSLRWISDNDSGVWRTSELNICNHISCQLRKKFPDFDVDVELVKEDKRRPDIVIHSRGNEERNLVVFQVKKQPTTSDIADDLNKISTTFFSDHHNYAYGIFISILKLPAQLPAFDKSRIKIIEVDGWKIV